MVGLLGPQVTGAWRFRIVAPVTAVLVGLVAWALTSDMSPDVRRQISGAAVVVGCIAVALSCAQRVRQTVDRRRRAWTLLLFAGGLAVLGNAYLLLVADRAGERSGVSPADFALFAALLLGVIGALNFPLARRRSTDLARMVLDGVVMGGSTLFVLSVTIFPQILAGATDLSSRLLPLLVPVLDVVIATLTVLLALRSGPGDRPGLILAGIGFILFAFSDFSFAVRTAQGGYVLGGPIDLGWIAGWGLITLAIICPDTSINPPSEPLAEASPVMGTTLLFVCFGTAAVLSLVNARHLSIASGVLWLLVLLAVTARQILLIIDNERLRRGLVRRVIERSNELRTVTQQSDLVVDSVGDGIYGVDSAGLITFVNPAAERALGYRPGQLVGRNAHDTFHSTQSDGTPYPFDQCYVTDAITKGIATTAEDDAYVRADGTTIPVEVTATPLTGESGIEGAVVVFRDVTQRREVDRLKNEFVSMVSHELRTPLTAIRGSLGLLAGGALGPLNTSAERMVELALSSSDRLARLIDEILDLERIQSGMLTLTVGAHSAADLVDDAVSSLRVIAAEAKVTLEVATVEGEVWADADRIVQTLVNLIGNAIKFSPIGGTVRVFAGPGETGLVEFRIVDEGRGIPEDKLESIFDRFHQVDSSDARDKGGSGLGLAISRSLVAQLGGRLWAENNPDRGATFRFTVPIVSAAARVPESAAHSA